MKKTVTFLVAVTGDDPPPDWEAHVCAKMGREMELLYGSNVTVEYVPPEPDTEYNRLQRALDPAIRLGSHATD